MPLTDACRIYQGQSIVIQPEYGWGWSVLHPDGSSSAVDYRSIDAIGLLGCKIIDFFEIDDELRGFIARLDDSTAVFGDAWIVATAMVDGLYDFEQNLCPRYDLEIGYSAPCGTSPHVGRDKRVYIGFGVAKLRSA